MLPSGAYRVRVYAGLDPLTGKRNYLTEVVPPGPKAASERKRQCPAGDSSSGVSRWDRTETVAGEKPEGAATNVTDPAVVFVLTGVGATIGRRSSASAITASFKL
jgi:hypothetical protein